MHRFFNMSIRFSIVHPVKGLLHMAIFYCCYWKVVLDFVFDNKVFVDFIVGMCAYMYIWKREIYKLT